MLIQLISRTLHSDNHGTLSSDIGGTGYLCKVTSKKLKKFIQTELIQLVCCTLHSDNGGTLYQIMVVLNISLKSLVVS